MKNFYISSKHGNSGITKYSNDFYRLVLKDRNYEFIDSEESISSVLSAISSRDHTHIEISIFQKKEIEILFRMLNSGYKNVSVTLHDAPLIKYPFHEFENPLLNKISKFYDKYLNRLGAVTPYINKIESIYVLSRKGLNIVKAKYGVNHVYYLPHIIDLSEIQAGENNNQNFIYFGFIGRNKGIEYSLELHKKLLLLKPDIKFFVVGDAIGKEQTFYNYLKIKYTKNVFYLGYVPEEVLHKVFESATFALLPFKEYKFYTPVSGSILYSLKKGKVVLTNKVNAIAEIIENGKNGIYLTGNLKTDLNTLLKVINNKSLIDTIKAEAHQFLKINHSADAVNKLFDLHSQLFIDKILAGDNNSVKF